MPYVNLYGKLTPDYSRAFVFRTHALIQKADTLGYLLFAHDVTMISEL